MPRYLMVHHVHHSDRPGDTLVRVERVPDLCDQPHINPVVGALAVVGGIVVAAVVLSALFGDD